MNSKLFNKLLFVIGLISYLVGLFILVYASVTKKGLLFDANLTSNDFRMMKIVGLVIFAVGFTVFMISIIKLYQTEDMGENNFSLIIDGKADVITIIMMTYILIVMMVLCLIFDELIGAVLFGIAIIIQNVLNNILVRYYNKKVKKL
jgi:hypothetical protein